MKKHVIKVNVKDGEFDYNGREYLCVNPGDAVIWEYPGRGGQFAVQFGFESPFAVHGFQTRPRGSRIAAEISNRHPGIYKYSIAVYDGHRLHLDDPVIIIKPPKKKG
jgi:hypothetical protein